MECLVASAMWSLEDPLFPAYRRLGVNLLFIACKCGIMLISKGWCLIDPLSCYYRSRLHRYVFFLAACAFVRTRVMDI